MSGQAGEQGDKTQIIPFAARMCGNYRNCDVF